MRRGAQAAQAAHVFQDGVEALALDELHRVEIRAVVFAAAVDGDDVGMVQPAGDLGLAAEARRKAPRTARPGGSTLSATRRPSDSCTAS